MKKKELLIILVSTLILVLIFFNVNNQEIIDSNSIKSIDVSDNDIVIYTNLPKYRSVDGSAVSTNSDDPDIMDVRIFTKFDLSMKNNNSVTIVPIVTELKKINVINKYGNIIYSVNVYNP